MKFHVPKTLKFEHEQLHQELPNATNVGGRVADAAIAVAEILHPHFLNEEEYALPPLGLLPLLAEGIVKPKMRAAFKMTDKLKAELPQMLEEHKAMVSALRKLAEIAKNEKKIEYARLAEKLILHAQLEEEVNYPTAILIGEYLKSKLAK